MNTYRYVERRKLFFRETVVFWFWFSTWDLQGKCNSMVQLNLELVNMIYQYNTRLAALK